MNIQLAQDGPSIDIPKLISTRAIVQGASGSGKSYLLRLIAEGIADKIPTIIIDPEGEFFTIREHCSMILVGASGEIRIDPKSAGHVARGLLEQSCSAIIDLSDLPQRYHQAYVGDFIRSMMSAPRKLWHPTLIAIDEAHRFCPEGGKQTECGEAIKDLASRGRKRGYGVMMLTQRISKVSKDAAAECTNQILGLTTLDLDIKRSADMLGMKTAEAKVLNGLKPGEWFAHGPAFDHHGVCRFRAVKPITAPPKGPGQATPPIRDEGVLAKLAESVAKSLENTDEPLTLEEAMTQIEEQRKTIKTLERNKVNSKDTRRIIELEAKLANADQKYTETQLQDLLNKQRKEIISAVRSAVDGAFNDTHTEIPAPSPTPTPSRVVEHRSAPSPTASSEGISASQQRVLDAIGWFEGVGIALPTTKQIAARASISVRHAQNLLSELSGMEMVQRMNGTAKLTVVGRSVVDIPSSGTLKELHVSLMNLKSLSGSAKSVLEYIIENTNQAGDALSTSTIADGLRISKRHAQNLLSEISSVGIIDRANGYARATEVLYPPGLK